MEDLAPIVLFVYNRIEHVKKTLEALQKNDLAMCSDLYIFSDGPKTGQEKAVDLVRNYIDKITGFKKVQVIKRKENWGLARSIIEGVSEIIGFYGKVIVLEDDIICSNNFLKFMNQALDEYRMNQKVFSITGYSFLSCKDLKGIPDTYFLKIISSWSWATWKNRWDQFDECATGYQHLKWNYMLRRKFNYDDAYDYYSMLMTQMCGKLSLTNVFFRNKRKKLDSWAIRWYWTVFKNNGLTLYPRETLVANIGFDGTGTHCGKIDSVQRDRCFVILESQELEFEKVISEKKWIRDKVKKALKNR